MRIKVYIGFKERDCSFDILFFLHQLSQNFKSWKVERVKFDSLFIVIHLHLKISITVLKLR
jgi:hypothetical protein